MSIAESHKTSDNHSYRSTFVRPEWPVDCDPAEFCKTEDIPAPPVDNNLVRMDNKTRFRVGEHAYFGCTEPEAVLENDADLNIFELECKTGGVWDTTFDKCVVEPVCDDIPDPEVKRQGRHLTNLCTFQFRQKGLYFTILMRNINFFSGGCSVKRAETEEQRRAEGEERRPRDVRVHQQGQLRRDDSGGPRNPSHLQGSGRRQRQRNAARAKSVADVRAAALQVPREGRRTYPARGAGKQNV